MLELLLLGDEMPPPEPPPVLLLSEFEVLVGEVVELPVSVNIGVVLVTPPVVGSTYPPANVLHLEPSGSISTNERPDGS